MGCRRGPATGRDQRCAGRLRGAGICRTGAGGLPHDRRPARRTGWRGACAHPDPPCSPGQRKIVQPGSTRSTRRLLCGQGQTQSCQGLGAARRPAPGTAAAAGFRGIQGRPPGHQKTNHRPPNRGHRAGGDHKRRRAAGLPARIARVRNHANGHGLHQHQAGGLPQSRPVKGRVIWSILDRKRRN